MNPHPNLAKRVAQANRNYNKVFGIGFNKTGTTTLEKVLKFYGFRMPVQTEQEALTTRQAYQGNYLPLIELVKQYDAFQDQPFSQHLVFVALDALFPNSKFILTVRDSEAWYESLVRYHTKLFDIGELSQLTQQDVHDKFKYLYPGYSLANRQDFLTTVTDLKPQLRWDLHYNKEYYIDQYEKRNDMIVKYFMHRQSQLLVMDITQSNTTQRICEFLNIPEDYVIEMPHENSSR